MSEIDALKNIDEILSGLDDKAMRDRVLSWACQKYAATTPAAPLSASDHRVAPTVPTRVSIPTKSKGKSRAKVTSGASPSIARDLNLKPKGGDSFDVFAGKKNPGSNQQKCVVAVYYLQHELDLHSITVDHVYTCFKHMQWRVPSSLGNTMAYVSSVHGWLDTRNMGNIKLTTIGENVVEHDLPKRNKAVAGT